MRFRLPGALPLLLVLVASHPSAAQWTQFRGPNGSGVDGSTGYPVEFSASKSLLWKASIPFGQSSPVVGGSLVFLTGSDGDRLITMAFDPDLDVCAAVALREMIAAICARTGLSREDAYTLCSLAADLRITQVVNGNKGVHAMLDKRHLTPRA